MLLIRVAIREIVTILSLDEASMATTIQSEVMLKKGCQETNSIYPQKGDSAERI